MSRAKGSRRFPLATEWFDLGLDLDREAQRKLGHAHRRAGVISCVGAVNFEDQVAETVDHVRLLGKTGRGIYMPKTLNRTVT